MEAESTFDPITGRFLSWLLNGSVILGEVTQERTAYTTTDSLNQFAIILSFIENVIFTFEEDALQDVASWDNDCKQKSFDVTNNDECLSARLGKSVQHAHRMAALIQTIEIGFIIYQKYLEGNDLRSTFLYQLLTNEAEPFQINAPKLSALGQQVIIVAPDNQTSD
ncbi:unnamed protein product [Adineta steineri]|uniref:Uncharacterized protein n=1 Tax=Adineta steineri TaxID=433720 RepID=A0A819KW59_9BILA|nr:unnamed protein product [Adineta steineri]CAF3955890.1 unnamed protein product [Adineta steineri]